jgi:PAS domain S-box-containing protein
VRSGGETALKSIAFGQQGLSGDELALLLDAARAGTFRMDVDTGELRWSDSLAALTGVRADQAPATFEAFLERVHPDDRACLREAVAATSPDGQPSQHEMRVGWPDGAVHWYDSRWRQVHDEEGRATIVGIVRLVDAEQAALQQSRLLADISVALDASLDMDGTLEAVADLCVRTIADWCVIDLVDDDGRLRNVAVAHVDPARAALARKMRERYPPERDGPGGAAHVVRTGKPELIAQVDPQRLEHWTVDAEHLELVNALDASSVLLVPLRARGRVFGALSLVRTRERPPFTEDDVAFATEVAARAALAVDNARLYGEARSQERTSSEATALLDALIAAAPIGMGFLDSEFRFVRVNDAMAEIHGVPAIDHLGRTVREVLPDMGEAVEAALARVASSGEALVGVQLRGETPREPGRTRRYLGNYYPVALGRGERLGIGATIVDVTDRAEAAEAVRAQRDLYEALMRAQSELGQAFVLLEGERIVYANAATEVLTGRTAEELAALPSLFALLPEDVHRVVGARLVGARAGREPDGAPFRTQIVRPDGTRVPIEAAGRRLGPEMADRLVIIARDISDRVAQERELQRVLEVEQAARRASEAAHARVRLLADASALLERSLSSDEALQQLAELLVARVADACTLDVVDHDGALRRAGADARAPDGRRRLMALAGDPRVVRALEAEQATFLEDLGAHGDAVLGQSATLVPLIARGRAVGVLSLGWRDVGRRPARDEWSLIEALAQRIALAVDGAVQYRERAHVAQTLQASLLPAALPEVPRADVAAEYLAAGEGMEVGGDFYDVFALDDGAFAMVIGDVLGKGAEAAAVTALARYTLRAVAGRSPSPAATLAALNDEMLRQSADRRFVTAVLARLEPLDGGGARLVVACGGHPPPVVLRAGGGGEVVGVPGTLLGVEPEIHIADCEARLDVGDALVLYTDGVTEARRDRPLTPQALADLLAARRAEGAGQLAREVVRLAEEGASGPLRDDLAVLAVVLR